LASLSATATDHVLQKATFLLVVYFCILAEPRITQTVLHSSPGTLVCQCQRPRQNSNGVTPHRGPK